MKPISPYTLGVKSVWYCIVVNNRVVSTVKGHIEAGDLWKLRKPCMKRMDGREVVWLVKGRRRNIAFEIGKDLVVDQNRLIVGWSAMHDSMSHSNRLEVSDFTQPIFRYCEGRRNIGHVLRRKGLID